MDILFNAGLLLIAVVVFFLTVLGYFLVSRMFQSESRRGLLSRNSVTFSIAASLFVLFTASYLEIFAFAFRLPYSAVVDLGIGLVAVALSSAAAYLLARQVSQRSSGDS